MNNRWNRIVYKIWSPVYDKLFNSGPFLSTRKKIFQENTLDRTQPILFVGVGTGADLEQINYADLNITAIDYSPEMIERARKKFRDSSIQFKEMDALNMSFANDQFDIIIGSLILSVVPNADKCFKEMIRVLKQGGEIILFDKFSPKGKELSPFKKVIRPIIKLLGTDIG